MKINGVVLFESSPKKDSRGFFRKVYARTNEDIHFDLREMFYSESEPGVFRGMHLQTLDSESGRIISLIEGDIIDVLIDLRKSSDTYLNVKEIPWNRASSIGAIYVPPGVAHGFLAKGKSLIMYLSDKNHAPNLDTGVNIFSLSVGFLSDIKHISDRDQKLPSIIEWSERAN